MDPRPIDDLLQELGLPQPECRRVLLVDDEFEVLTVLEALLEDEWEVHTATGGQEALDILAGDNDIDLVITDQRMPEMTGVELLAIIAERWPDMFRIVLTAYSDVDPIVAAINHGSVDRFVLKPWDPHELRAQVEEGLAVCTRRQSMRAVAGSLADRHQAMNRTLRQLKDAQERASATERLAVLGWMTTGLATELMGLLEGLRSVLRRVDGEDSDPEMVENARAAHQSLERVRGLLDDMERLGGASQRALESKLVAPRKLISEAVRLLLDEELGDNPVHVQIDPDIDALTVDARVLRQALLGLLRNATVASPPEVPIEVRVRRDGTGMIAIEVIDQGPGMSPEVLQQAAQPFFSAFEPPGNGLGLSICQLVAEAHGGRLALLDNPPTGVIAQLWLQPEASP